MEMQNKLIKINYMVSIVFLRKSFVGVLENTESLELFRGHYQITTPHRKQIVKSVNLEQPILKQDSCFLVLLF